MGMTLIFLMCTGYPTPYIKMATDPSRQKNSAASDHLGQRSFGDKIKIGRHDVAMMQLCVVCFNG